jgi:hypothetical protein
VIILSVANLKPTRSLALDDDLAVPRAQFDLANVSARVVNLLGDQGRALWAAELCTAKRILHR